VSTVREGSRSASTFFNQFIQAGDIGPPPTKMFSEAVQYPPGKTIHFYKP
jgi:hypothetical protein